MAAPTEFWNEALKDAGCACKNQPKLHGMAERE